ncbi:hypothetical protein NX059_006537 [Plenodomus lindquistii]|nr:hypothetical protein NX059_006537 [Plenodomus lindquistii]
MIVRESPKSRVQNNQPNWPPQSPVEALLSSPSGRKKYESRRERASASPSPSKRRPMSRHDTNDDTEEEDEETLQLKLQAIEAKLKIKALQKKKATENESFGSAAPSSSADYPKSPRRANMFQPAADVQVPHSPVRIRRAPEEQKSPARVILGIDKGLTARDISLRRPGTGMSGRLSRADSQRRGDAPRIKSFSERIAESKIKEKDREEKEMKIETRRSRGFGLHSMEGLKERSASRPESSLSAAGARSSKAMPPPPARGHSRTHSQSNSNLPQPPTPRPGLTRSSFSDTSRPASSSSKASFSSFGSTSTAAKYAEISQRDNSAEATSFESNSGLHLKSREMPHNDVTRALEGKTILTIPQLLKTVKGPAYDPPDYENDYVILGVICSKSEPISTKNAFKEQSKTNQEQGDHTNKFMVLKLTDLKYEMDLFLFDTGFSHFWKLPLGTLIAVLNPDIMPPRNRDTGKFNLKLSSSDDTIIELGTARDLDFCHAKKADGQGCKQWIDSRKTEYCEWHIQLQVEKSKRGRMEINTMTGMGNGPRGGSMFGRFTKGGPKGSELKREGRYHDRELHETVYIAPAPGGAARLIDRDRQQWEGGAGREDKFRKQLAAKEKERELAKKLGTMGDGSTGGDYMKIKGAGTQNLPARGYMSSQGSTGAKPAKATEEDISSLLNRTSADVSLAPVKRKRTASAKSSTSSDPVGWGFKYGRIPSPKKAIPSAFQGTRDASPIKKKARLLLPEKGIREPGRESLGGLDVGLIAAMDDDDDDLEVV